LSNYVKSCQGFPWPFRAFSRAYDAKLDQRRSWRILSAVRRARLAGNDASPSQGEG
jgi:hypothetical protein